MSVQNTAAWVVSHKAHPFQIKPAPLGVPEENEILIRNRAIGINPIEHKIQNTDLHKETLSYPAIFGEDVAGEVVSVGPGVTKFKPGDRVAGLAAGFYTQKKEEMAYQAYMVLKTKLAVKIPEKYTFQQAAAFPLAVGTSAAALFNPDALNLQFPTHPARESTGKVVLVWGGASAVGCSAIQLAVSAGYEVLTTASPKNFDLVKRLGASHVFDYKSPTVVADLLKAAEGKESAGVFDCVGFDAAPLVQEFAHKVNGVKFISCTVPGWPEPPAGVTLKHVFSLSILQTHVAKAIWDDYLPDAIEAGTFVPAPVPLDFGSGLESLQGAVDFLGERGVSARKVVVSLD
ncbi:hypothetical protein FDECE_7158 [Fusarium decemcellulare]|nr:hypothetical protein FDECE_7158 [Fusarium decemcellulare]